MHSETCQRWFDALKARHEAERRLNGYLAGIPAATDEKINQARAELTAAEREAKQTRTAYRQSMGFSD